MTETKNTFKELLKKAIGDNTNSAFAEKIGVTRVYLQYLLSGRESNPSIDLIIQIVKHSNGRVTTEEMFDACGIEAPNFTPAQQRSLMSFRDWCDANVNDVIDYYKDINDKKVFVFNSESFKSDFRLLFAASACRVIIGKHESYEGEELADAVIPVTYKWTSTVHKKVQEMQTLLLAIQKKNGQLVVIKAICAPADMVEASPRLKAELTDINDTIDDGSSLFEAPYIYSTTELSAERDNSFEQRLFDVLFGHDPDNVLSFYGFGFYLEDEPKEFFDFVKNHEEAFLKGNRYNDFTDEDARSFMENVIKNGENPDRFFSEFEKTHLSGRAQIIAGIIENETGFKISGNDHENEDDRNRNCVFIPSEYIDELEDGKEGSAIDVSKSVRKDMIRTLTPYAKELGVDTLETCFFYYPVNANESFWREHKIR